MSGIKVLVVEDNPLHAEKADFHLAQLGYEVVALLNSGEQLIPLIKERQPDLVLLDIQIEGDKSGIELAAEVRANFDLPIIFLTSFKEQFVFEKAMETLPDAYLNKPLDAKTLQHAIELAVYKHAHPTDQPSKDNYPASSYNGAIYIKVGDKLKKVTISDIIYINVSYKNYCDIHTAEKQYSVKNSLSEIEHSLPEQEFIRIHRTTVVNLNCILEINEKDMYVLTSAGELPIGNSFKPALIKRITKL